MSKRLERTIEVYPGYDRRHTDRAKDEGMHGAEFMFILRGEKGSITFRCYTDWLPLITQESLMEGSRRSGVVGVQPVPQDMVIHSPTPLSYGQLIARKDCPYTATGVCYSDTSSKIAHYLRDLLLLEGSEGVWRELQVRYRAAFSISQFSKSPDSPMVDVINKRPKGNISL